METNFDLGWKEMCLWMETNFAFAMERNVPLDGKKCALGWKQTLPLLWKEMCLWMETNFDLGWIEMWLRMERNLTWDEWVLTHMQIFLISGEPWLN
jgi:hypothetical protein